MSRRRAVAASPGGSLDFLARLLGGQIGQVQWQTVRIEVRAGRAGRLEPKLCAPLTTVTPCSLAQDQESRQSSDGARERLELFRTITPAVEASPPSQK